MAKYRVVHYINQFYAGIGGEEQADTGLFCEEGPKGPGMAFKGALGPDFEIVATIYCGDNYAVDHTEQVMPQIIETIRNIIRIWSSPVPRSMPGVTAPCAAR